MNVSSILDDAMTAGAEHTLADKVRALKTPACYSDDARVVETIETHFAWIFLVGDYAYKLKKPIRYREIALERLEERRANCAEELRLNRRLAPEVYLAVVPLMRRDDGLLRVGGAGTPVDWLVHMRRLPADAALDRSMAAGELSHRSLTAVGIQLAKFYRAQPGIVFAPMAYASRIAEHIHDARRELLAPELSLDSRLVRDAVIETRRAFRLLKPALGHRAFDDRIVEAHGDLRPEHIFLGDPPCVIDCLEFSKDLRTLDPLEELAFFSIECERAGHKEVARAVIEAYCRASGDVGDERLLDFYRSCRALVRGKILAWHLYDPAVMNAAPWREYAEDYMRMAARYARRVTRFSNTVEETSGTGGSANVART